VYGRVLVLKATASALKPEGDGIETSHNFVGIMERVPYDSSRYKADIDGVKRNAEKEMHKGRVSLVAL
jgi:hypothetical protein